MEFVESGYRVEWKHVHGFRIDTWDQWASTTLTGYGSYFLNTMGQQLTACFKYLTIKQPSPQPTPDSIRCLTLRTKMRRTT